MQPSVGLLGLESNSVLPPKLTVRLSHGQRSWGIDSTASWIHNRQRCPPLWSIAAPSYHKTHSFSKRHFDESPGFLFLPPYEPLARKEWIPSTDVLGPVDKMSVNDSHRAQTLTIRYIKTRHPSDHLASGRAAQDVHVTGDLATIHSGNTSFGRLSGLFAVSRRRLSNAWPSARIAWQR
jgi:hypothetical protein